MPLAPILTFPALTVEPWLRHAFLQRVPGIDVNTDRENALLRLEKIHRDTIVSIDLDEKKLITAQQIHSANVVRVTAADSPPLPDCDGLITNDLSVALAIYVADCGAIYLADPVTRSIGLVHSGKKGTELGILTNAVNAMSREFGTRPENLIIQLGPCIRPPHYDVDFAKEIARQAAESGVIHYHDCGICTGADAENYYSYRREMGKTGRLLAVLAVVDETV